MTVKKLISILKKMHENKEVILSISHNYLGAVMHPYTFEIKDVDEYPESVEINSKTGISEGD